MIKIAERIKPEMFDMDILTKITMPGRTPRRPIRPEPTLVPNQNYQQPARQPVAQPQVQPIVQQEIQQPLPQENTQNIEPIQQPIIQQEVQQPVVQETPVQPIVEQQIQPQPQIIHSVVQPSQPVQEIQERPAYTMPQRERLPEVSFYQEYNQVTGTYNSEDTKSTESLQRTEEYPNRMPHSKIQEVENLAKGIFTGDFFKKK